MSEKNVEYFQNLAAGAYRYLSNYYDYLYLKAMHKIASNEGAETIIVGSSHTMNGIAEEDFSGKTLNFSISSQDLYYSYLHIKKVISESPVKIKNCIINLGYYTPYWDLSLSTSERVRVGLVYGALFNDWHNYKDEHIYKYIVPDICPSEDKELMQKLCEDWALWYFQTNKTYYTDIFTRQQNNQFGITGAVWADVPQIVRDNYAKERAGKHNRHEKRLETLAENRAIIDKICSLLKDHSIRTIFLICPYTKWYNSYISKSYKKTIFDILDELPYEVELVDMNDIEDFVTDKDFIDSDHLLESGAHKLSQFLNDYLMNN